MTVPEPITTSRIGAGIRGAGWRDVWKFGGDGFRFVPGTDDLEPGGAGTYQNWLRDLKAVSPSNNTAKGAYFGGPSDEHNGDYAEIERVMFTGWQTAIHFHSVANVTFNQVYITNPVDARGDLALRVTGGSSNSFHMLSTTIANCDVGLSFETPGAGNVVYLGDIGNCRVAIKLSGAGSRLIVIGGNIEATCDKVAEVGSNCELVLIGTSGHGQFQQPPIDLSPGNGTSRLARYFANFATADGVQVIGAGYGNTASIGSRSADERFDANSPLFTGGQYPILRSALAQFFPANASNYNAQRDVIGDAGGPGGLVRVSYDSSTGTYFHAWSNQDI